MSNPNPNITAAQWASLTEDLVNLVIDLRSCESRYEKTKARLALHGITTEPGKDEPEIEYLARLASQCKAEEMSVVRDDELREIGKAMGNAAPVNRPRSWAGRKLNQLASLVG